jgi:hypothetical protein
MTYLILKAVLSGVIVMVVSEVARRSPGLGALIASLPLVSLLAMIWLWRDTGDPARIAALAEGTFWLVLPTLPMFLALPYLLRRGFEFWPSLLSVTVLTMGLYAGAVWLLPRLGIRI